MIDKFHCAVCKQNTIHHIIYSYKQEEELVYPGDFSYQDRTDILYCTYEITLCAGCETVCFREKWFDHLHQINEDGTPDESCRLYPTRGETLAGASPEEGRSKPGLQSKIRNLIHEKLLTDADFNAFCQDNYSEIYSEFGDGMNKTTKINLLIQRRINNLEDLRQKLEICNDVASPKIVAQACVQSVSGTVT